MRLFAVLCALVLFASCKEPDAAAPAEPAPAEAPPVVALAVDATPVAESGAVSAADAPSPVTP